MIRTASEAHSAELCVAMAASPQPNRTELVLLVILVSCFRDDYSNQKLMKIKIVGVVATEADTAAG
jgi:hypothetical protein